MAGRPKVLRLKQSIINSIDNRTECGNLKMGLPPRVGVTQNFWNTYATHCNMIPGAQKKTLKNMVFLNINPAKTPGVSAGFPCSKIKGRYNNSYLDKLPETGWE